MNELKMKAKAGVTLVELLVVILIVTILSVSLLPLLKPYIEKAKYAAEPIPVLANLQTKIELYGYEHEDKMPCATNDTTTMYYTWQETTTTSKDPETQEDVVDTRFMPVDSKTLTAEMYKGHLEDLIEVDWQDLKGKRMRPNQFQYCVTSYDGAGSYCYAVGVFGDGNGLSKGTGYAVCKIVDINRKVKVVGTWEKYKAEATANQVTFKVATSIVPAAPDAQTAVANEPIMPSAQCLLGASGQQGLLDVIKGMEDAGWQFN